MNDIVEVRKEEYEALAEMTEIFSNFLPAIEHCHKILGSCSPFNQDLIDRAIHLNCSLIKESIPMED